MSERKTIQINPELFKFSTTNKTRKKRDKIVDPNKPIHVKSPRKESAKSARNRLLKYIRQHQDAKYNHMTEHGNAPEKTASSTSADAGFERDFEDSLKYLSSISEKTQNTVPVSAIQRHNATLRNPSSLLYHPTVDLIRGTDEYVNTELPDVFQSISVPASESSSAIGLKPMRFHGDMPKYGCLKNGALPTYRMWKNQTMKALPPSVPAPIPRPPVPVPVPIIVAGNRSPTTYSFGEIQKHREIQKRREIPKRVRAQKQRRIMRRTYRVGKSKHYPKVVVLVSNKTLRKEITTKTQLLKQVPIEEVKKTLIKKGLIKVGSTAPNDVLRKMYESISLVCGDIQNHNPENLLYNYFNDHS